MRFEPELLFMRGEGAPVPKAKTAALDEIRAQGFRIVAVVDNEPENLAAMAAAHGGDDILFLHADTIFESQRRQSGRCRRGNVVRARGLISEDLLREHVELVWHGVNDEENLRQFLGSGIRWAEIDLRLDPVGRLVLRHDGFDERPWNREEHSLPAQRGIEEIAAAGRSIKLDVKENGDTLRAALDLIDSFAPRRRSRVVQRRDRAWSVPAGFAMFRDRYPDANASCPIDFLVPCSRSRPTRRTRSCNGSAPGA